MLFGESTGNRKGLPAMNFFDYFQMAGLVVYFALLIGRTIHLRVTRGVSSFVLGSGKSGFPAALEISFFLGLLIWLAEAVLAALHAPFRIFPPAMERILIDSVVWKSLGSFGLVSGCGLFAWSLISFGASWRVGIDTQTAGPLVKDGVFSFSRNPIFLSIDLFFLGTFLILGSVFFLAAAILVAVGMHYQILQEEKHLRKIYGEAYRVYCEETARYFSRRLDRKPTGVKR
jgi:protein-S-isoprenylcysteine O-methyltransferase Ste14